MPTENQESANYYSVSPVTFPKDVYDSIHAKVLDKINKDTFVNTNDVVDIIALTLCEPNCFQSYIEANKEQLKKLGFLSKEEYDLDDENFPLNQDLSELPEEQKKEILRGGTKVAADILFKLFKAANLKTHIAMKIEDVENPDNEYVLTFVKFTHEHREP